MATAKIHTRKRANGSAFYQVQVRGKGLAKPYSASFDYLEEAQEWADEQNRKLAGEAQPVAALTLIGITEEYLNSIERDQRTGKVKKGHTDLTYKVKAIARRFGDTAIDDINEKALVAYKMERFTQVKPSSVRKDLEILRRFLVWANKEKGTQAQPEIITQSFLPAEADRRETVITDKQYSALCGWCASSRSWLEPIMIIAYETAMRRGEILSLQPEWIDFSRRCICLPEEVCKNGKAREVPLSQTALIVLEAMIGEGALKVQDGQRIFTANADHVSKTFSDACSELGIKEAVFHSLRHTAISRYAKKPGMNIFTLSAISGHADPAELKTYFHSDSSFVASLMD